MNEKDGLPVDPAGVNTAPPRVAVIAVHGVADQQPHDTARALVDMLLTGPASTYAPFSEEGLRLTVGGLAVPGRRDAAPPAAGTRVGAGAGRFDFDERAPSIARHHAERRMPKGGPEAAAAARRAVMERARFEVVGDQIDGYQPDGADRIYASVCLRGERNSQAAQAGDTAATAAAGQAAEAASTAATARSRVDVYELYWADLSRIGGGALQLVTVFYQLLFHVCGLGRKTLDFACIAFDGDGTWTFFRRARNFAERLLVLVVPVLNLCLLGLGSAVIAHYLAVGWSAADSARLGGSLSLFGVSALPAGGVPGGAVWAGLAGGALAGVLVYRWRGRFAGNTWPMLFFAVVAAIALAAVVAARFPALLPMALALVLWALAVWAIQRLMRRYEASRPAARAVSELALALTSVVFVGYLLTLGAASPLVAAMATAEWVWLAFEAAWGLFVLTALVSSAAGVVAVGRVRRAVRAGREPPYRLAEARDAAWTAHLSLSLPGLLFAVFNLAAWMAANRLLSPLMPGGIHYTAQWPLSTFYRAVTPQSDGFIQILIDASLTASFVLILALCLLALLLVVWSVVPLVMAEVGRQRAGRARAAWYGRSLTETFTVLRAGGLIVHFSLVVGLIASLVLDRLLYARDPFGYGLLHALNLSVVAGLGTALVLVVMGSSGPLRFLGVGMRAGLDVAVDVANWLRLHPRGRTPRARITARCVALLEHVAAARPAYDGVLIVAHSQGSVIIADTLRFLRQMGHPLAARFDADLPVWLMTYGCPLRQLYAPRFPHQYGWARDSRPGWPTPKPDPATLGVQQWSNCYRSGDYVGRFLWYGPEGDNPAADLPWLSRVREDPRFPDRRERCIGAGAHTHYWDGSAPEVGHEIDRLIGVIAARSGQG